MMDYQERIKRNSSVLKLIIFVVFAFAILFTLTRPKPVSKEMLEYERAVTYKTIGGPYAESAWDMLEAPGGGFVIAGDTRSFGAGGSDFYMAKTDGKGGLLWTRTFGGPKDEHCLSIENAYGGGYIMAGATESYGAGESDIYLVKTDADGDCVWARTLGGPDFDYAYCIRRTNDGNYILAGYTSVKGNSDAALIKVDPSGRQLWGNTFGGDGWDVFYSVAALRDGGFLACGYTTSFGFGKSLIYLVRTDASGNKLWEKTYGGKRENHGIYAIEAADGGFIVAAKTTSFVSKGLGWDVMLLKTDSKGRQLWQNFISAAELQCGRALLEEKDGTIVAAATKKCYGICSSNIVFEKADAAGNNTTYRIFEAPNDEIFSSIIKTSDGNYAICGSTLSFGNGMTDFLITKISRAGEQIW
jgi:hypothetical protein